MWVYQRCEGEMLWTVGFYTPDGRWQPESDHDTREEAAKRVHYLNGGGSGRAVRSLRSCSWCDKMNDTSTLYCDQCNHMAHVSRLQCRCPACAKVMSESWLPAE